MRHVRGFRLVPAFLTSLVAIAVMGVFMPGAHAAQVLTGDMGGGGTYEIYVPDDWNGELIVFVHGLQDPAVEPLADIPFFRNMKNSLAAEGYAAASASFSEVGWAVKDGTQRTHELTGLFKSIVGEPTKTYLVGLSMGGLIVTKLAETYKKQYDGALSLCGVLGGTELAFQQLYGTRVIFDYYFPGLFPGNALDNDSLAWTGAQVRALVVQAQSSAPAVFAQMANIEPISKAYRNNAELVAAFVSPLFTGIRNSDDLLSRTHGHIFFDNEGVNYSGSFDDVALNAGIQRFAATPDAENALDHNYMPTGDHSIPILTVHNLVDPLVPFDHEIEYANIVAAAGNSSNLRQQYVTTAGHCTFSERERLTAFNRLVKWVNEGIVPVEGDVTGQ